MILETCFLEKRKPLFEKGFTVHLSEHLIQHMHSKYTVVPHVRSFF